MPAPTPFDYDTDPGRYRLGMWLSRSFATASLYAAISEVLLDAGARSVLDVGCGNGPLRAALPDPAAPADHAVLPDHGPPWLVGLDASRRMLLDHPAPVVQGRRGGAAPGGPLVRCRRGGELAGPPA